MESCSSITTLFDGYAASCDGDYYPHRVVLGNRWKPEFDRMLLQRNDRNRSSWHVNGSEVVFDDSVEDFRFEDIKAD